jgi:glutamine amidotransferase PdxT
MATTFHPELTAETRVHRCLLESAAGAAAAHAELR